MNCFFKKFVLLLIVSFQSLHAASNVVFIISDDAGFADFGFMNPMTGNTTNIPTPHLDDLRSRGTLFTSAYTAAVCSPSRAAIVTGSYQQRIGYEYNVNNLTSASGPFEGIPVETETIFERMKSVGYTTGAIGKWHIGGIADVTSGGTLVTSGNRPPRQGVDEFFGIIHGGRTFSMGGTTKYTERLREMSLGPDNLQINVDIENNYPGQNVTNVFGQGAIDFIDRHYQSPEPFFLYVAMTAPHRPVHNSPDFNDSSIAGLSGGRKQYASMMLTMDKEIGRIMDKLEDPNGDSDPSDSIVDDTLIVFMNDNGGSSLNHSVNLPLRGFKGNAYEGGIRVPLLMAGPGIPVNATYDGYVHSIDLLPTFYEFGGGAPLSDLDGVNLLPYIDGTNSDAPHDVIVVRSNDRFALRKGDWKLVKQDSGFPFELYNLSSDIGESNDLSATEPAKFAELIDELVAWEVVFDKPRHHSLNQDVDSINRNDLFRFDTPVETINTGPNVVRNPGFESGTQSDSDDTRYSYIEIHDWTNNGDSMSTQVAAFANNPHSGLFRCPFIVNTRIPYQLTDHTIALGDTMFLEVYHRADNQWLAGETFSVQLFYLDDNSQLVELDTIDIEPTRIVWKRRTELFPAITDTNAVGRTLGIRFISNGSAGKFVAVDDVFLATGMVGPPAITTFDWSGVERWIDGDTSLSDTLLDLDGCPQTILEFPVNSIYSYTANNNMKRLSELEFMANTIRLTGTHPDGELLTTTVAGDALLLTADLSKQNPKIEMTADGDDYRFDIATDLIIYDELILEGDGTATFEVSGDIRSPYGTRGITKSGTSTLILSGTNIYTGATAVTGGTLVLNGALNGTSGVTVDATATLVGTGSVAGSLISAGTLAPGLSPGTLTVGGDVVSTGSLQIELDGSSHDKLVVGGLLDITAATLDIALLAGGATESVYIIATYDSIDGPFAQVSNIPAGYYLNYAYDDGSTSKQIALTTTAPFDTWVSTTSNLSGGDADFEADPNYDGVSNGLAFVLGAVTANADIASIFPSPHYNNTNQEYTFFYRLTDNAGYLQPSVQVSFNLEAGSWDNAQNVFPMTTQSVSRDFFGPGIDRVEVVIPVDLDTYEKVFTRLSVTEL